LGSELFDYFSNKRFPVSYIDELLLKNNEKVPNSSILKKGNPRLKMGTTIQQTLLFIL